LGVGYFGSFYILDNDRQIDFGVLLSGLNSACLRFCGVGGCCNFLRILGGVAGVTVWVALVLKGGTYGWNWLWF
jgi:hypothetical protein